MVCNESLFLKKFLHCKIFLVEATTLSAKNCMDLRDFVFLKIEKTKTGIRTKNLRQISWTKTFEQKSPEKQTGQRDYHEYHGGYLKFCGMLSTMV